jgi:predicted porin
MKIIGIAALAACVLGPVTAAAQTSVTAYGRIDTSVESTKTGNATALRMNNNSSRLGFRGVEDMGGSLEALFGIELAVSSDDGSLGSPAMRNSYVGLRGTWGIAAMGRIDSGVPTHKPLYAIIARHMEFVAHDAGTTAISSSVLNVRTRTSNTVAYQSPVFQNFVVRASYNLNGEAKTESATGPIRWESDYRQADLSLSYGEKDNSPLGFGIGYGRDSQRGGIPVNQFKDKWIGIASYDFGPARLWGVYGQDRFVGAAATRSKVNIALVGASVEVGGSGNVVANYMTKDVQSDTSAQRRRFQMGYTHRLSKRTSVYALYDRDDPSNKATGDVIRSFGVGIQHSF